MKATKTLVNAMVTSRLDYCNSLLLGITTRQMKQLQKIQNSSARLITYAPRREHITPTLQKLHWLRVDKRINYKILLHTYRCLHGTAPSYLTGLLNKYHPQRDLRSKQQSLLNTPSGRTLRYGKRFDTIAPELWNKLPPSIREAKTLETFKKHLKTYLFKQ